MICRSLASVRREKRKQRLGLLVDYSFFLKFVKPASMPGMFVCVMEKILWIWRTPLRF